MERIWGQSSKMSTTRSVNRSWKPLRIIYGSRGAAVVYSQVARAFARRRSPGRRPPRAERARGLSECAGDTCPVGAFRLRALRLHRVDRGLLTSRTPWGLGSDGLSVAPSFVLEG